MFTPIEICIDLFATIYEKFLADMPDLHMWPALQSTSDVEAHLNLMTGIKRPPAFAEVGMNCYIPESNFAIRKGQVWVRSSEWLTSIYKIRIPDDSEINSIIEEEYQLLKNVRTTYDNSLESVLMGPTISIQNSYKYGFDLRQIIIVRYLPLDYELNLLNEESQLEKKLIANLIYEDFVSLRRIYNKIQI